MATKHIYPLHLDPAYYTAIGEVAARGALLEQQLGDVIQVGFALDKKEGRVLTSGMSIKVKSNIVRALTLKWIKDPKIRTEAKKISSEAFDLMQKRNEIVHGTWGYPNGDPQNIRLIYRRSAEERIMPKAVRKTPDDIAAIAAKLLALQKRVLRLLEAMGTRGI